MTLANHITGFRKELERNKARFKNKYKPKSWRGKDAKAAINRRQGASRKRRRAKKRNGSAQEIEEERKDLQEKKSAACTLIQDKIERDK